MIITLLIAIASMAGMALMYCEACDLVQLRYPRHSRQSRARQRTAALRRATRIRRGTLTPDEAQHDVIRAAVSLAAAQSAFDWVTEPRRIDTACYVLSATEQRLEIALRRQRGGKGRETA